MKGKKYITYLLLYFVLAYFHINIYTLYCRRNVTGKLRWMSNAYNCKFVLTLFCILLFIITFFCHDIIFTSRLMFTIKLYQKMIVIIAYSNLCKCNYQSKDTIQVKNLKICTLLYTLKKYCVKKEVIIFTLYANT